MEEQKIVINVAPNIPALPRVKDKTKIDMRYMLISPYASAHIYFDHKLLELIYEVEEPLLTNEEKALLRRIEDGMKEIININVLVEKTQEAMIDYLNKTAQLLINELDLKVPEASYKKMFYYLFRDFIGLNEIEPLIRDYFIEDIECNGIDTPTYIVHRLYRNLKTNIIYKDIDYLASFIEKLAQRTGKYISYASPLLDGSLPNGSRVNATYTADVSSKGPTFTIRQFSKEPWSPPKMIELGTVSPEMLAYLWILVENEFNVHLSIITNHNFLDNLLQEPLLLTQISFLVNLKEVCQVISFFLKETDISFCFEQS